MRKLEYWSNIVWKVVLDEDSAKFRRKLLLTRSLPAKNGWAVKSNGRWFGVYRKCGELCFQCDAWRCRIEPAYQCLLEQGSTGERVFAISSAGQSVFEHHYRVSSWARKYDPTYDDIDAQSDDFFLWLYRLWNDPAGVDDIIRMLSD
jgi:hypothetical protein